MTDMLGQHIYSKGVVATGGKLNEDILLAKEIPNGMYLLNISTPTNRATFHVVVRR
jgi:hypothetical protein